MDLAGVRGLLGAFEQADAASGLFLIAAASPQVRRILELTGNAHVLAGGVGGAEECVPDGYDPRARGRRRTCRR
jgi:hypothetical protein